MTPNPRHYACPSLSLRGDGVLSLLSSREQAEPFFASMARTHVDQGCADWRTENIRIHAIGSSPHIGKLPRLVNPLQAPESRSCQ